MACKETCCIFPLDSLMSRKTHLTTESSPFHFNPMSTQRPSTAKTRHRGEPQTAEPSLGNCTPISESDAPQIMITDPKGQKRISRASTVRSVQSNISEESFAMETKYLLCNFLAKLPEAYDPRDYISDAIADESVVRTPSAGEDTPDDELFSEDRFSWDYVRQASHDSVGSDNDPRTSFPSQFRRNRTLERISESKESSVVTLEDIDVINKSTYVDRWARESVRHISESENDDLLEDYARSMSNDTIVPSFDIESDVFSESTENPLVAIYDESTSEEEEKRPTTLDIPEVKNETVSNKSRGGMSFLRSPDVPESVKMRRPSLITLSEPLRTQAMEEMLNLDNSLPTEQLKLMRDTSTERQSLTTTSSSPIRPEALQRCASQLDAFAARLTMIDQHGDSISNIIGTLYALRQSSGPVTYEQFNRVVSQSMDQHSEHLVGLNKALFLMLLSRQLAFTGLKKGYTQFHRLVNFGVRVITENCSEYIMSVGGWENALSDDNTMSVLSGVASPNLLISNPHQRSLEELSTQPSTQTLLTSACISRQSSQTINPPYSHLTSFIPFATIVVIALVAICKSSV